MAIGILAATALALTGCASGGGGEAGGGGGSVKVTVGAIPIPDTAPLHIGKEKGFFSDEGIDLTIQPTTGGAAAVPGVVSGTYDFAFGNYVSVMVARDKGLPLRYVANGDSATPGGQGFQAVVVKKDSPIKDPKDLTGKRVSVNNLSNINDTTIREVVDRDGGNDSKIHFVEVNFPDAEAAVANGQVDAATVNPYLSTMKDDYRVVTYNFSAFDPKLDVAGYFTKESTIKDKPDLVKKFAKAMNKSLEYSQDHPDEVRKSITTYTKMSSDMLSNMTLPTFTPTFDRAALTKLGDAAQKYGTLKKKPDLDAMLPEK